MTLPSHAVCPGPDRTRVAQEPTVVAQLLDEWRGGAAAQHGLDFKLGACPCVAGIAYANDRIDRIADGLFRLGEVTFAGLRIAHLTRRTRRRTFTVRPRQRSVIRAVPNCVARQARRPNAAIVLSPTVPKRDTATAGCFVYAQQFEYPRCPIRTPIAHKLIPCSLTALPIRVYGRTAFHWIRRRLILKVRGIRVRSRHQRPAGGSSDQQSKRPQVRGSFERNTQQATSEAREGQT